MINIAETDKFIVSIIYNYHQHWLEIHMNSWGALQVCATVPAMKFRHMSMLMLSTQVSMVSHTAVQEQLFMLCTYVKGASCQFYIVSWISTSEYNISLWNVVNCSKSFTEWKQQSTSSPKCNLNIKHKSRLLSYRLAVLYNFSYLQ